MKIRKYWCNAMSTYNQKYAECPEIDTLENVSEEIVVALNGEDHPLQINKLPGLLAECEAKKRGERIWRNEYGVWSATPFGKFVD